MAQDRERKHIGKGFWQVSLISTARHNEELEAALWRIREIIDEVLGDEEEAQEEGQGQGEEEGRTETEKG